MTLAILLLIGAMICVISFLAVIVNPHLTGVAKIGATMFNAFVVVTMCLAAVALL